MKLLGITFLFLFLLCGKLYSAQLRSKIELLNNQPTIVEGDIVSLVIKIWPIENIEREEFSKLIGKNVLGKIQILKINSMLLSENNSEVVEITVDGIAKPSPEGESTFDYKGQLIPIEADEIKVVALKGKKNDFYIADQSLVVSYLKQIVIGLLSLLLLIGLFVYGKNLYKRIKLKKRSKEDLLKKHYVNLFEKAKTRSEYEEIYADKKIWQDYLKEISPPFVEFYKVMEENQYRPEWNEQIFDEVKERFDIIRGSLK